MKNKWQMTCINSTILIITLNVYEINIPVKSQRLLDWIKKQIQLYVVYQTHSFNYKTQLD